MSESSGFFTPTNEKTRWLFTRRLAKDKNPFLLQTVGGTEVNFSLILKIPFFLYRQQWP